MTQKALEGNFATCALIYNLRKTRIDKDGKAPIYVLLTANGGCTGPLLAKSLSFCYLTDLAFTDVQQLKAEYLVVDIHGKIWIRKARQKTKNKCNIPLLNEAQKMIDRYRDHPTARRTAFCFPYAATGSDRNRRRGLFVRNAACGHIPRA